MDFQRQMNPGVGEFSATALSTTRVVADELAELVTQGVKCAHATLERDFVMDGDTPPAPGDLIVILDGAGAPRAVVRIKHVEKRHFEDIDDEFAFECGEGDRTLAWWLVAYRQTFSERAVELGYQITEKAVLILEQFECIWPPVHPPRSELS
jgi:uncharacterized protein YhfF